MVVPFVKRAASAWWFYAASALICAIVLAPVVRSWGVPRSLSSMVAVGAIGLLFAPFFNVWVYARTSDWSYARKMGATFYAVSAAISAGVALVLVRDSLPWAFGASAAIVVLTALLTWGAVRRIGASIGDRVLRVSDPEDAADLVFWCDEQLEAGDVPPRRQAALRLSLAHGLIVASARPGCAHLLITAFEVLDEARDDAPPRDLLAVSLQIVEAMDAKLERAGDAVGREDALALLMEAARRASADDPAAMAKAHAAAGRSRLRQSRHERADGDDREAERLRRLAVRELRRAVEAAPRSSDEQALATLALIEAEGPKPLDGTIDDAIARCRAALRRLWIVGADERMPGYLVLADLLELRARLGASGVDVRRGGIRASRDLALALRLCLKLANSEHEREARRRIPHLQEQLAAGRLPRGGGRLQRRIYRRLVAGERVMAPIGAIDTASAWATWAMERDDAVQAAEAWQAWVTVVVADLRRRVLRSRNERLPAIQRQVTVAAQWMVRAGRPRDAILALECARAVLMTDRLRRRRLGLAERLRAAGRPELGDDWEVVASILSERDLAGGDRVPGGGTGLQGSQEYLALVEHERLLDEVSGLPGFEDVDPVPRYADVLAAAADGPLVYLAAADDGGFALVVDADRADPVAVDLPLLTRDAVHEHVAALRATRAPFEVEGVLSATLPWLWETALAPVVHRLPRPAGVTLVAVGALGELPLHAAVCRPGADGVWRERLPGLVLCYAPNARMLRSAQEVVRDLAVERPAVLTVPVPHAPGKRPLRHAVREAEELRSVFGDRLRRPQPATVEAVTSLLDSCGIWHFACHGVHEPGDPLASSLVLQDGPLTLGAILARPGARQRLAVLSACQTAKIGDHAPDEVVGFPSAMLQAGVAGVVSCLAEVEDDAAMLLVARFAQLIERGQPPAHALSRAQSWLRAATNRELHEAFPVAYPRAADVPPGWDEDHRFAAPSTWALFSYTGA